MIASNLGDRLALGLTLKGYFRIGWEVRISRTDVWGLRGWVGVLDEEVNERHGCLVCWGFLVFEANGRSAQGLEGLILLDFRVFLGRILYSDWSGRAIILEVRASAP